MSASLQLAGMRTLAMLQAAAMLVTRRALVDAEEALTPAVHNTRNQVEACNIALERWHDGLAMRRPDPLQFSLAGAWVVEQEKRLSSTRLDEEIARRQRLAAAQACAEKTAQQAVADKLRGSLIRRIARLREERETQASSDRHLSRWRP